MPNSLFALTGFWSVRRGKCDAGRRLKCVSRSRSSIPPCSNTSALLSLSHPRRINGRFEQLALSFNGGKDCLVLLLLYIYALKKRSFPLTAIPTCFVTPPATFPEVDSFVTSCSQRYNLSVTRISLPLKAAFAQYLAQHEAVKAVLVGTRRTDPHGETLTHFDKTDRGWPEFMRVHPVINWHYWEIWDVNPDVRALVDVVPAGLGSAVLCVVRSGVCVSLEVEFDV
jgi:3'-phosphoadenosine 5'-phosphosulfate sulfotransferase (PAPS reductase)/FAD synthetase